MWKHLAEFHLPTDRGPNFSSKVSSQTPTTFIALLPTQTQSSKLFNKGLKSLESLSQEVARFIFVLNLNS
jgi:hypothetical protein